MKRQLSVYSILSLAAIMFASYGRVGFAQSDQSDNPLKFGGFENRGEITAGYRFSDVHGYRPQFQYMFGLQSGFRVQDVTLYGQSSNRSESFLDSYDFTATGLGGDPYSSARLKV